MADTRNATHVLIIVFAVTVITSLLRTSRIGLVYGQEREPPERRQLEPLVQSHKLSFLALLTIHILLFISTTLIFLSSCFKQRRAMASHPFYFHNCDQHE